MPIFYFFTRTLQNIFSPKKRKPSLHAKASFYKNVFPKKQENIFLQQIQ
jgi:hypothetical protein